MDIIKSFQVVIKYISNIYIYNCKKTKLQGFTKLTTRIYERKIIF